MREPVAQENTLKLFRTAFLLAAFLYIAFGFLMKHVFEMDDLIPLTHRLAFGVCFSGLAALSYISSLVRRHIALLSYGLGWAAILHLLLMGSQGRFDSGSIVALLLIIPILNFLFYRFKPLLYANALLFIVIVGLFTASSPTLIELLLFLLSSASISGLSFWFTRRLISTEAKATKNERMFQDLFQNSIEGIAIHEMVFDGEGQPIDYVFLEVNPTFEEYTGLSGRDILGKRVTEVLPGIEDSVFIQKYGAVVRTGKPIRFEEFSEPLQRYYRVAAYPVGDNRFATAFEDITLNKQWELELKQSQELYQHIVDTQNEMICRFQPDTTITFANPAYRRCFGLTNEDIHRKQFLHLVPQEEQENIRHHLQRLARGEPSQPYEHQVVIHGKTYWQQWQDYPVFDKHGEIQEFQSVGYDITHRKFVQEELQKSEEHLSTLLSETPAVIYSYYLQDGQPQLTYINENVINVLGFTPKHFLGDIHEWYACICPDDVPGLQKKLTGVDSYDEYRFRDKEGHYHWLADRQRCVSHQDGRKRVVGAWWDITERREMEIALRESEERYKHLSENAPVGLFRFCLTLDGNFAFHYISETTEDMTGVSADAIYHDYKALHHHIHPKYQKGFEEAMFTSAQNMSHFFQEVLFNRGEDEVWLEVRATPKKNHAGDTLWDGAFIDIDRRKRAEQQLEEERLRLQNIIAGTNVGTWECNLQTGETRLNSKWAAILGYTLQELEPISINTWMRNLHPKDFEPAQTILNRHIQGELDYYDQEARMGHKDGHWVWVQGRGKIISWSEDGKPEWMFGTHVDITDRKQAEAVIEAEAENRRILLDNIQTQVWFLTNEYTYGAVNESHAAFAGLSKEELAFKDLHDIFPKPIVDVCRQSNVEVFRGEQTVTEEWAPNAFGEERLLAITKSPVFAPDGSVEYVVCSAEDITEDRQVEKALKESRQQYLSLVENTPGVVYHCRFDKDWTMLFLSDEIRSISGYKPEEFIHNNVRSYASIIHPKDSKYVNSEIENAVERGVPWEIEYRLVPKAGGCCWVRERGQAVFDQEGHVDSLHGLILDINIQKIQEAEIARQQERLELFFSQSLSGAFFMMIDKPISWKEERNKAKLLEYVFHHQRMTQVNQAMLQQYGAQEEDFLGQTPFDLFQHDLEHGYQIWHDLFEQGQLHVETKERRMDGTPMIIEGDYICLYDEEGRITGHFGVQQDITYRKQNQEQRDFDHRFRKLIAEASANLVRVLTDVDFDNTINQTLEHLGELFTVDRCYLFQFFDDQKRMSKTHEWCAVGVKTQRGPVKDQPTDALPWWKEGILEMSPLQIEDINELPPEAEGVFKAQNISSMICIPTRGVSGNLSGFLELHMVETTKSWSDSEMTMLQIAADIIGGVFERRRAEEALQESEERHRVSFEQSKDAIMTLVPPDWRFSSGNAATIAMFGVDEVEKLTSLGPWDVSPKHQPDGECSADAAKRMIATAMHQGSHYFEWTHQRIDGTEFPTTVLLSRMQMGGKGFLQAIVRDITEHKEAETKLANYAAELERLYATLDTEMQNARKAHLRLIQKQLPTVGSMSLVAVHKPATYIGGDFSCVIPKDDQLILYLSDITGHGLEGTIFGLFVKGCIESYVNLVPKEEITPHRILAYLDQQVRSNGYPSEYAVAIFIMVIDTTTRETAFSAAGFHNPPVLIPKDGQVELLASPGLPISTDIPEELMEFVEHHTLIPDNAVLFLSTDGLYEQEVDGQIYERRACQLLEHYSGLPSKTVADVLEDDLFTAIGQEEQSDDVTFMVLSTVNAKEYQVASSIEAIHGILQDARSYYANYTNKDAIIMGIHELVANSIEHGNKFDAKKHVKVLLCDKAVVIEDEGLGYDWRAKLGNKLNLDLDQERGRGIAMTQLLVGKLVYNNRGNRVSLILSKME